MPTEKEFDAARRAVWKIDGDEMTYDEALADAAGESQTSRHSQSLIDYVNSMAAAALVAAEGVETDPHRMLKRALFRIAGTGCRSAEYGGAFTGAGFAYISFEIRDTHTPEKKFKLGDRVQKVRGSSWRGPVVGFYSTPVTPVGYCVESENEPGSVQVWPEAALEAMPPREVRVGRVIDDKATAIEAQASVREVCEEAMCEIPAHATEDGA